MTCHSEASMTMIYDYVLISQDAHGLHCSPNISSEFLLLFWKFQYTLNSGRRWGGGQKNVKIVGQSF